MRLVAVWDPVGENQFVLKDECKKCYAGEKYLGILSELFLFKDFHCEIVGVPSGAVG